MKIFKQSVQILPAEKLRIPSETPKYIIDEDFLSAQPRIDEYLDELIKNNGSVDHGNAQAMDSYILSSMEKALAGIEEQYVSNVEELEMRRIKRRADLTGALITLAKYKTSRERILVEITKKRAILFPEG